MTGSHTVQSVTSLTLNAAHTWVKCLNEKAARWNGKYSSREQVLSTHLSCSSHLQIRFNHCLTVWKTTKMTLCATHGGFKAGWITSLCAAACSLLFFFWLRDCSVDTGEGLAKSQHCVLPLVSTGNLSSQIPVSMKDWKKSLPTLLSL